MSRGLALALPALVAVACFLPLVGLALGAAPWWIAPGVMGLLAIVVSSLLLRDHGLPWSVVLSVLGVAAGTALFLALTWGLSALGSSQDPRVNDLANTLVTVMPLVILVLALAALVVTFRALPSDRLLLGAAWAIALATPFALSVPIGALSDRAGNAGMDVVALFGMPLAAFFIWAFILLGVFLMPEGPTEQSEASSGGA
jgi:hypothetical protein